MSSKETRESAVRDAAGQVSLGVTFEKTIADRYLLV